MATTAVPEAPTVETRAPGIYPGVGYDEYARIEGARFSLLRHFEQSAAHARAELLNPRVSRDLDFGHALHCAVLEPTRFAAEYVRGLEGLDRRFKADKARWAEFCAEHKSQTVLLPDEWDAIQAMQITMCAHETAADLLHAPGANEVVVVWDDAETGIRCRSRLDRICSWIGWTWVPDVKSTTNASPQGWPREVANFGYAEQAAFYLDGLRALDARDRRFVWIAIEKRPPYAVAVHEPDDEAIAEGRRRYRRHLRAYAEAVKSGNWPAYPTGVLPASLPRWAIRREEEEVIE